MIYRIFFSRSSKTEIKHIHPFPPLLPLQLFVSHESYRVQPSSTGWKMMSARATRSLSVLVRHGAVLPPTTAASHSVVLTWAYVPFCHSIFHHGPLNAEPKENMSWLGNTSVDTFLVLIFYDFKPSAACLVSRRCSGYFSHSTFICLIPIYINVYE